jgi:hypothetical protein
MTIIMIVPNADVDLAYLRHENQSNVVGPSLEVQIFGRKGEGERRASNRAMRRKLRSVCPSH